MLNQKTLRKQKIKNILRDSCLDSPKSEESENQKNLGKTKKTQKTKKPILGSLEEKGVQPRVSENCFFVFLGFFGFPKVFFVFFVFLILGGPAKSLPELFFFVFCFLKAFLVLFWFLSCMHIYQCFLVLIVALLYAYLSVFFGFDCGTDAFT